MAKKKGNAQEIGGFLKGVERVGNALPHPAIIFLILSLIVIAASGIFAGTSVEYFDAKAGEMVVKEVESLANAAGVRYIFNSATTNFTGFAPLGTVLVAMLGVGVAEWTGLINTTLKKMLSNANPRLLTAVIVFAGIMSNIASDAGYVVVIPLGAIIFANAGRHPIAGLAAAFAGVSGGFSANLLLGTTDPLLTDITNAALEMVGIPMQMNATANWYFLFASTFLLTILGTFVTEKIVEKNLGEYTGSYVPDHEPITEAENRGLRNAGIAVLIYVVFMGLMMALPNGIFREFEEAKNAYTTNAFMSKGFIPAILLFFLIPGAVYGKTTGKMKNSHDLVKGMTVAMQGMGGYLVLAFFASQFVAYFGKTNLGLVIAYNGAELLKALGVNGLVLVILFILLSAFLNLFMGSASAKWAIMAPIFVPMLYEMGLHPALTQVAYRIGDSTTNIISPLMSYFAMIVVFMQKYDEDSGLGTLISTMLPYSMVFLAGWIVFMIIWYLLGIPVGPGAPLHVSALLSMIA